MSNSITLNKKTWKDLKEMWLNGSNKRMSFSGVGGIESSIKECEKHFLQLISDNGNIYFLYKHTKLVYKELKTSETMNSFSLESALDYYKSLKFFKLEVLRGRAPNLSL